MATLTTRFPGTIHQQALLAHVDEHYRDDSRVRAVCLSGALARGESDKFSDIELDVILAGGVRLDLMAELHGLCGAFEPLGERALLVVPDGEETGHLVLSSLAELSIRYHPIETTGPGIVDDLLLLSGSVDLGTIKVAGRANRKLRRQADPLDVDRILRWAVEAAFALRRKDLWQAVRRINHMRDALAEIYASARGYPRAYPALDQTVANPLMVRLSALLPRLDPLSIREALDIGLDMLEGDLGALSEGRLRLTEDQQAVIGQVRELNLEP